MGWHNGNLETCSCDGCHSHREEEIERGIRLTKLVTAVYAAAHNITTGTLSAEDHEAIEAIVTDFTEEFA